MNANPTQTEHREMTLHTISRSVGNGWSYEFRDGQGSVYGGTWVGGTGAICRAFTGEFIRDNDMRLPALLKCIGTTYKVFLVNGMVRSINGMLL